MPRKRAFLALLLAGGVALLAPASPALLHYGALPQRPPGPVNVLLAGTTPNYPPSPVWPYPATPEDYSGITDTIVLAQFRPPANGSRGEVRLLSIPRDTWMNVPGWGYGKINGANPHGGPAMLVAAVRKVTGLPVDAYALLSLNALRDLTNAAGGVTLDVPERMKYDDNAGNLHIDLQPGVQHLTGRQVEGFLRFRYDARGDIGRVERQQQFLGALSGKLRSPLNLWRLPAVVGALDDNMKSDLTRAQAGALLGVLAGGFTVSSVTLPGNYGSSTWLPDGAAISQLVRQRFADPARPQGLSVALVNVDAPDGSARRLKARLEAAGYSDVRIVSEDRHARARTGVSAADGVSPAAARALTRELGYGAPDSAEPAPGTQLTVRLGSDVPR